MASQYSITKAEIFILKIRYCNSKMSGLKDIFMSERLASFSPPDFVKHGCNKLIQPTPPPIDPLLQVITLQNASGFWTLVPGLTTVLGKTCQELAKSKPPSVTEKVWATILALIWLHAFKMDAQDEWQLLAVKAVSWVHAQKVGCLTECLEAGNTLLGCKVQKEDLGL